jgi:hypothetical protein
MEPPNTNWAPYTIKENHWTIEWVASSVSRSVDHCALTPELINAFSILPFSWIVYTCSLPGYSRVSSKMRKWSKKVPLFLKPPGLQPGVVVDAEERSCQSCRVCCEVDRVVAFSAKLSELSRLISINPHRHRQGTLGPYPISGRENHSPKICC